MGRIVTTELPNLVPQQRIDDDFVIHFLHWEFCDLLLSSHKKLPLWARLYQHVFCKKPSLFLSSSRYRSLGPSESACWHYAYPSPVPLLLAAPLVIHEKSWRVLVEHHYPPDSLWDSVAIPAPLATVHFVILRRLHCFCVFGFCRSTRRVSPCLLTHNLTSYCCWIFRADHSILRWRCWRSRWRWSSGTRRQARDNEWYVVRYVAIDFLVIFGEHVVSGHSSNGKCTQILRRASLVKELRVFLREA